MPPDYDILLGDHTGLQGYRVRSFVRDSAPLIASRFSTGSEGESDLNLIKSKTLKTVSGGMFQDEWIDDQKASRVQGVFNRYNNCLYPTPTPTAATGFTPSSSYSITAKVESELYSFIAINYYSAGTVYNKLFRINRGSTVWSEITLPAAIVSGGSAATSAITDLAIHKDNLFVAGQDETATTHIANHRYNIQTGVWQNIGGYGLMTRALRGVLYHLEISGSLYSVTNEFAAGVATYTLLDQVGSKSVENVFIDAFEFNGALYICKVDGIYRFDGVKASKILSMSVSKITVFNGALYFSSNNWLVRFDGANLERIQYFGNAERIIDLSATTDALIIQTRVTSSDPYPIEGKPTIISSGQFEIRTYSHDGVGFFLLDERAVTASYTPSSAIVYVGFALIIIVRDDTTWNKYLFSIPTLLLSSSITSSSKIAITTSDFDAGFPNVLKSFENIRPIFSNKAAGDSISISYQLHDGSSWGSWTTINNVTGQVEINTPNPKLFLRLRAFITATLTSGSSFNIKSVSIGHTIQPRLRWRWQTILMAEGNGSIETRNNVAINSDSNELSNVITKAIKLKTPMFLAAPDYARVNLAANNSATSIRVGGQVPIYTDPYNEPVFIAVKNAANTWEILKVITVSYDSLNDQTTITISERGYLGITAGSISIDAEMRILHKVYITRLLREAAELNENIYSQDLTTKESQIKREFTIEITEV